MSKLFKGILRVIPIIILVILIVPLTLYFMRFHVAMAPQQETWAHFGDYFNAWISLANLVALLTFSFVIHHYEKSRNEKLDRENQTRNDQLDKAEQARNRPILVFEHQSRVEAWKIRNISNSPALNIYVGERKKAEQLRLTNIEHGYPSSDPKILGHKERYTAIAGEESLNLSWTTKSNKLFALYQDILENDYIAITDDFETIILYRKEQFELAKVKFKEVQDLYNFREKKRNWIGEFSE